MFLMYIIKSLYTISKRVMCLSTFFNARSGSFSNNGNYISCFNVLHETPFPVDFIYWLELLLINVMAPLNSYSLNSLFNDPFMIVHFHPRNTLSNRKGWFFTFFRKTTLHLDWNWGLMWSLLTQKID